MSLSWEVRARSPILFFHEYCMTASAAVDGPEMNVFLPVCVERAPPCPPCSAAVVSRYGYLTSLENWKGWTDSVPMSLSHTQLCSLTTDKGCPRLHESLKLAVGEPIQY